jgi:hypothetical protein
MTGSFHPSLYRAAEVAVTSVYAIQRLVARAMLRLEATIRARTSSPARPFVLSDPSGGGRAVD